MTHFFPLSIAFLFFSASNAIARSPEPPSLDIPSPSTPNRFFVECHCFIEAAEGRPQDYGYHFRAIGRAESVPNGFEVSLERDRIFLSVAKRERGQSQYNSLYDSIAPNPNTEPSCPMGDCASVQYQFQQPPEQITIIYDKDRGTIRVEHQLDGRTLLQGRGGCAFIALPNDNKATR